MANINKSQQKVRLVVDEMMVNMRAEVNALQQRIEEVDREAKPKPIVVNKSTGKVHRVLTTMLDIGSEAVDRCGFK